MRLGKGFTLSISNEDMNDIIKIIKSLEDSDVLVEGVTETVKNEKKNKKKGGFLGAFFFTFSCFITAASNFFRSKRYKWKRS